MRLDARGLIEAMDQTWTSTLAALEGVGDADWDLPTGCPGWSVKSVASHMIWGARMQREVPQVPIEVPDLPHVRDDFGRYMEQAVIEWSGHTGAEVRQALATETAATVAYLRARSDDDLDAEVEGPAGARMKQASFLNIQLLDQWTHEQDIRVALGRPGHLTGAAPTHVRDRFLNGWGQALSQRVTFEGSTPVVVAVTGPSATTVGFDLAAPDRPTTELPANPAVTVTMPFETFIALACGRDVAGLADTISFDGDVDLGARLVAAASFTP